MTAPDRTEAAEYYFRYIDLVPPGDICNQLEIQGQVNDTLELYARGGWTDSEIKESERAATDVDNQAHT